MMKTIKLHIRKNRVQNADDWDDSLKKVLYGYPVTSFEDVCSPFKLMYGIAARMRTDPLCTLPLNNVTNNRPVELLSIENNRFQRTISKSRAAKQKFFFEGYQVFVARGQTFSSFKKNSALSFTFMGLALL